MSEEWKEKKINGVTIERYAEIEAEANDISKEEVLKFYRKLIEIGEEKDYVDKLQRQNFDWFKKEEEKE